MTDPQRERAIEVAQDWLGYRNDPRVSTSPTVYSLADLLLEFAREERLEEAKVQPHELNCNAWEGGSCNCSRGQRIAQLQPQPAKKGTGT